MESKKTYLSVVGAIRKRVVVEKIKVNKHISGNYIMGKLEHYALDFDAIESTLEDFFSEKGDTTYTFIQDNEFTYRLNIIKTGVKKPGIVLIYNKQGLYCLSIAGAPVLNALCKDCCDFILQRLQIPNAVRQAFSIKNVDAELAAACVVCLGENYTVSNEKGDVPDAKHYLVSDTHRSSVSVICYDNGTVYVQGACTTLFLKVCTEVSKECKGIPENVVDELIKIAPLVHKRYEVDIHALVTNPKPLIDNNLDVMVLSSVVLANSAVSIYDFGPYAFGVLKAIEGLLALKLQTYFDKDNDFFSKCYHDDGAGKQKLNSNVHDFDSAENAVLKATMEDAYNFIVDNRNTSFHIRKLHVEASRILTEEEALDIIDDGLDYINKLCDNW